MTGFAYHRPSNLVEALELLSEDGAVALSGGTDLLVAIRHRKTQPRSVVDLKSVSDMGREIDVDDGVLNIGGRATMGQLANHEQVKLHFPALAEAASVVGSVQIRNRATLAGNLCNASPAADTAPALLVYGASVRIKSRDAERVVPVEDFFVGPGITVLRRGEVVTSVGIPIPAAEMGSAFARVTRRRGVDLASVNLACVVDTSGEVRYGFGAVAPTPILAISNVASLGRDEGWAELLTSASPISDVRAGAEYRRAMLEVHSKRALSAARDRLARSVR